MKLLFNLVAVQPIHNAKFHGGGSYGEVVFWALLQRLTTPASGAPSASMACLYDSKKYLDPQIIAACQQQKIHLLDIHEHTPQEWIDAHGFDSFYTPLYSLESIFRIEVPRFVFTWHGVRALEISYSSLGISFAKTFAQKAEALVRYRELWKRYFYQPKYQQLAQQIAAGKVQAITVSEHSRASIKAFFPELMHVDIPVYYSPMGEIAANGKLPAGVEKTKYFLLTSGARWEKNNLRAVQAFDDLITTWKSQTRFDYRIIVTGVTQAQVYTRHLRNPQHFVFLNYVENEELEYLHQNAYAFIFPSLNEGFGYPPMQSMRYGVPVAASGTTSIPEICDNAALYFDPYSISEIKNRVIQLLDPAIYSEYSARATQRYQIVKQRQASDLEKTVAFILDSH